MYTKERDDVWEDHWSIYDPEGVHICIVTSESQALGLLSHLNKG